MPGWVWITLVWVVGVPGVLVLWARHGDALETFARQTLAPVAIFFLAALGVIYLATHLTG